MAGAGTKLLFFPSLNLPSKLTPIEVPSSYLHQQTALLLFTRKKKEEKITSRSMWSWRSSSRLRKCLPLRVFSSSSSSYLDQISIPIPISTTTLTLPQLQSYLYLVADATSSAASASVGYSTASYYTSLGLFVISVPGLWSLINRSVKSKVVQKTFIEEGKKAPNQVAGEILSFFTRNNFSVLHKGETITFEGMMVPSSSQAALLTFCTCISLASVALVLTITLPDVGNNWFWLTILSPLAGVYYWKRASRKEQIKVRMMVADDGTVSEIIVQGDDQQVDLMRKELQLSEKGMVYVKGIFER